MINAGVHIIRNESFTDQQLLGVFNKLYNKDTSTGLADDVFSAFKDTADASLRTDPGKYCDSNKIEFVSGYLLDCGASVFTKLTGVEVGVSNPVTPPVVLKKVPKKKGGDKDGDDSLDGEPTTNDNDDQHDGTDEDLELNNKVTPIPATITQLPNSNVNNNNNQSFQRQEVIEKEKTSLWPSFGILFAGVAVGLGTFLGGVLPAGIAFGAITGACALIAVAYAYYANTQDEKSTVINRTEPSSRNINSITTNAPSQSKQVEVSNNVDATVPSTKHKLANNNLKSLDTINRHKGDEISH